MKLSDVKPLNDGQIRLAVLGFPINHSISPELHNAALSELSTRHSEFSNWIYQKIEVNPQELSLALVKLASCGYRGLNLTIPHKVDVLSHLHIVEKEARNMGAVNTLLYNGHTWEGFNTDGYGLEKALLEELSSSIQSSNLIILGAGGAARATVAHALSLGCERIWIGNRSSQRLTQLISTLGESYEVGAIKSFNLLGIPEEVYQIESPVIVNATSLGLGKTDLSPLSLNLFSADAKVYDMIYNPAETTLLANARARGMEYANGLSMLVHQAVRSLEIWTQKRISVEAMFSAAKSAVGT